MKKILVSIAALLAIAPAIADGNCGCKSKNCKPKKVRLVYVGTKSKANKVYTSAMPEYAPIEPMRPAPVFESEYDPYYDEYEPAPAPRAPRARSNWYLGGRVGLDLLTWRNEYTATPASAITDPDSDHDTYIFEPVFGGDLFLGYHFTPNWRGDLELGYISQYSDTDNGITFNMSTFYGTLNAYYDFTNRFYVGGGLGFAFPRTELQWEYFTKSSKESDMSMMLALMAGWTYDLSNEVVLDLRYRISGWWGPDFTRGVSGYAPLTAIETNVGFVLDNQLTIGLRYEF